MTAAWTVAATAVLTPGATAQESSRVAIDTLRTRAERTDYRETTRYAEAVDFLEVVAEHAPHAHLRTMGYTSEGRPIPMLVMGEVADGSPEAVRASGKVVVYLQGNIHAGEVPGKEALLMLARELALEPGHPLFRKLVLLFVPIYNADGNERVTLNNRPRQNGPLGGMGQRPNAQGYDLNRDHMKLDSPEARSVAAMLSAYDPHIGVDLHTTNGTRHAYHLTYSPPLHPGTPASVVGLLRDQALPRITRRILERDGWHFYYYGNARERDGEWGWYTFDHRPRFNNNYLGLRNRIAFLSEAYAYATFRDRVAATLRFVEEILSWAADEETAVRRALAMAETSVVGERLPLRADFQGSEEMVEILMGEVETGRHPLTGRPVLNRLDVVTPVPMREYGTFRGTEFEEAPEAYYILPTAEVVEDRLLAHGVRVERLSRPTSATLEAFAVDSSSVASREFQGHRERTVFGAWAPREVTLPAGTLVVPVDQPLGRLSFYLLEPRSDDGLTAWGLLDDFVEAGTYPVYRRR
jgi:hypothetical protein